MLTQAAASTADVSRDVGIQVLSRRGVLALGCTNDQLRARLAAGRWRRIGRAIVLHNGEPSRDELCQVALVNCGPRSVLTSFTAAEMLGLTGWTREEIHVLVPPGVPAPRLRHLPVIMHRSGRTRPEHVMRPRRCHRIAPALVLAASSFASPRPGCGLLAAGVQQQLTSPADLESAIGNAPRLRHRAALLAASHDIGMGAQALSEIDFMRMCRRYRLPAPVHQSVRVERGGRRRYLDAEWVRTDGSRVAVEVDGAVHLAPRRWFDDQLRQNEISLSGTLVLRFPSVVVRSEPLLVVSQLRRALTARP